MNSYILVLTLPAFFILTWIEYLISKKKNLPYYNFSSSVANICIGIAERLSDIMMAGIFYSIFDYVHSSYGIFKIESTVGWYIFLLVITDFIWYWYHRSGHEINLFWAAHIVHHQSEDFNYTVSARITIIQSFVRLLFWSLLPLIGFPAPMVAGILIIHGTYPFFLHTRVIRKLGILEKLFVTPSHHRVHHASNEKYLDKNYGSIFIIWDKLFGTFEEEKEEPTYGLTSQLNSHSFLWQHFHYFLELWEVAKSVHGIKGKLKLFFGKPDKVPYEVREKLERKYLPANRSERPSMRPAMKNYILIQLFGTVILLSLFYLIPFELPIIQKISLSMLILITLINICAILEQRTWIIYLEYFRIMVILITSTLIFHNTFVSIGTLCITVTILYHFHTLNKLFISFIYGQSFYQRTFKY